MTSPDPIRLCPLDAIPDGRSRGFDPFGTGRDTMFVVRRNRDVFAWLNSCPHYQNARMAWRKDEYLTADLSMIRCSAHGALFGIEDGVCTIGPCLGQALTPLPVLDEDGVLFLDPAGFAEASGVLRSD